MLDELWYLADEAEQRAEQAYHRLADTHDDVLTFERSRTVSRERFRTLAERVVESGAPYGAHTVVYRPSGALLLVRHEGVDQWVLPGGEPETGESFRAAAERELREEAGLAADYEGLAMVTRYRFRCHEHHAWGVLPVFAARATGDPVADDPDGEISTARFFEELPEDTRDRSELETWRSRALDR